ncbi:unnamed protein product [Peronospora destructor]|uniref:Centromere protein J C-terminal domain-containing protein n=1 Tax=Peronospora destructor TaxID=86335 RepID=A0AAV0V471_9STRA|nr:unnamed protein product [Peronospora destructor]
MLRAQIVKMQIDEKARASKWKAKNDNVRQRVLELEEKNRDLADEIRFLKKERIEHEKNKLRILDAVFVNNEMAYDLLQRWNHPHKRSPTTHDKKDATARFASQNYVQPNAVDRYSQKKRYSYGRDNLNPLSEPGTVTGKNELDRSSVKNVDIASDAKYARASNAAATYEWADEVPANIGNQKSNNCEEDGTFSASTSSLSKRKVVTKELEHTSGKKELLYTDGSRKIIFPDGNEKDIDAYGHAVIKFTNGDHKELFSSTGIQVYYYYEAQTKLTIYSNNRKKTIRPNGDEISVFPDGTTMLEQSGGLREVTLLNQKQIRYFPDGQMTCVSLSGQETRIRSDSELLRSSS